MIESVEDRELRAMLEGWARSSAYDEVLETVALSVSDAASDEECAAAKAAIAHDPDLAAALQAVEALPGRDKRHFPWWIGVAAAAAVTGLFVSNLGPTEPEGELSELMPKGIGDDLAIAVEREGRRFELESDDQLREGDDFGLFYSATTEGYLTIVHGTEAALVVVHPESQVQSKRGVALVEGGRIVDVAGCEWLIAIFSDEPLEQSQVLDDVKSAIERAHECRLSVEVSKARSIVVVPIEP